MPIRDCRVVAIEGTHASGKTTLVHALVSHYRERGVHVACTGEPARTSPFMEEIVLHDKGTFDVTAELDDVLRETAKQSGLELIDIPRGLTTAQRVEWISARLDQAGVQPALP